MGRNRVVREKGTGIENRLESKPNDYVDNGRGPDTYWCCAHRSRTPLPPRQCGVCVCRRRGPIVTARDNDDCRRRHGFCATTSVGWKRRRRLAGSAGRGLETADRGRATPTPRAEGSRWLCIYAVRISTAFHIPRSYVYTYKKALNFFFSIPPSRRRRFCRHRTPTESFIHIFYAYAYNIATAFLLFFFFLYILCRVAVFFRRIFSHPTVYIPVYTLRIAGTHRCIYVRVHNICAEAYKYVVCFYYYISYSSRLRPATTAAECGDGGGGETIVGKIYPKRNGTRYLSICTYANCTPLALSHMRVQ